MVQDAADVRSRDEVLCIVHGVADLGRVGPQVTGRSMLELHRGVHNRVHVVFTGILGRMLTKSGVWMHIFLKTSVEKSPQD